MKNMQNTTDSTIEEIKENLKELELFFNKKFISTSIEFEDVSLQLSGNYILENISFKIESGTIHCIVGPNGGGKSSLLKSLVGQMPHQGNIKISSDDNFVLRYMPQMLDFDRTLPITVYDFMTMVCQNTPAFLGVRKKYKKGLQLCLKAVGMFEKRERLFGQLSGGEKQRILLAQALYPLPDLLLLDEPTAGIDDSFIPIFEFILNYLKSKGVTILWINHDIIQVKKIADAVTSINKKIIFDKKITGDLNERNKMEIII